MSIAIDHVKDNRDKGNNRFKRTLVPILIIILVIAVTVSIHLVYGRHPKRLIELASYVYWGAFLISLVGNATVILPGAVLVILANMGIVLYPVTGLSGPVMVMGTRCFPAGALSQSTLIHKRSSVSIFPLLLILIQGSPA